MDERFRDKRLWIGLGGLAIIFLCIAMCGLAPMAMFTLRQVPAYAPLPYTQPPAAEDGAVSPPAYYGYSPFGGGRHAGFSPLGFIASLFLAGLFALLLLGLLKRVLWGGWCGGPHRRRGFHHWHRPVAPEDKEWRGGAHAAWGPPWGWHGPGQDAEAGTDQPDEPAHQDDETPYTGPQE
jgi:hypothetical protein